MPRLSRSPWPGRKGCDPTWEVPFTLRIRSTSNNHASMRTPFSWGWFPPRRQDRSYGPTESWATYFLPVGSSWYRQGGRPGSDTLQRIAIRVKSRRRWQELETSACGDTTAAVWYDTIDLPVDSVDDAGVSKWMISRERPHRLLYSPPKGPRRLPPAPACSKVRPSTRTTTCSSATSSATESIE